MAVAQQNVHWCCDMNSILSQFRAAEVAQHVLVGSSCQASSCSYQGGLALWLSKPCRVQVIPVHTGVVDVQVVSQLLFAGNVVEQQPLLHILPSVADGGKSHVNTTVS